MVSAVHELEGLGLLVELGLDEAGPEDVRHRVVNAAAYDVEDESHRAWLFGFRFLPFRDVDSPGAYDPLIESRNRMIRPMLLWVTMGGLWSVLPQKDNELAVEEREPLIS